MCLGSNFSIVSMEEPIQIWHCHMVAAKCSFSAGWLDMSIGAGIGQLTLKCVTVVYVWTSAVSRLLLGDLENFRLDQIQKAGKPNNSMDVFMFRGDLYYDRRLGTRSTIVLNQLKPHNRQPSMQHVFENFNGGADSGTKKLTRKPNFGTFGPIIIYFLSRNIKP